MKHTSSFLSVADIYRASIKPDEPGSNELTAATDPKFTNAGAGGVKFRLQADSPAVDRGAVIPGGDRRPHGNLAGPGRL